MSTILGYPWGGADALWTRTASGALARGHDVLVAVSPVVAAHPRVAALPAAGARLQVRHGFTQQRGRRDRWGQALRRRLRSRRSLTAALDAFRPEYVLLCQGSAFDFLIEDGLTRWLQETGCPYGIICQSNDARDRLDPGAQAAARRFLGGAHRLIYVSTQNLRLAESQCGGSLAHATVVPNPVELPAEPRPLAWPAAAAPRLAVVARLEQDPKGLDVLLAALALVPAGDWQVRVFGRGPDEAVLRAQADALGLGPRLQFCGYEPDVLRIWREHHALLLPSRREGCALALLEAMACGRPVIATDVGGTGDWVEPGRSGYICLPGDAAALARLLQEALANFSDWPRLGAAAARTIALRHPPAPETLILDALPTPPAANPAGII